MNKEEKSIFNFLKRKANEPLEVNENYVDTCILVNVKDCRKLVNLIEKQQKEIEDLKIIEKLFHYRIEEIEPEIFIDKDKIREIKAKWNKSIAWANADDYYYAMKMLDELLGG